MTVMNDIRHAQALITWHRDPSNFSRNEWIRDIVVDYEEIIGGGTQGGFGPYWLGSPVKWRVLGIRMRMLLLLWTPHRGICGYRGTASICGQERMSPPFTFYEAIFIYFTHTCSTEFPQSPAKMKILSKKR